MTFDASRESFERTRDSTDSGLLTAGARRSERGFGTWQGRLPQELRLRGVATLEQATTFCVSTTC